MTDGVPLHGTITERSRGGANRSSSKLLKLVEYEVHSPRVNQFDALTPDAASATARGAGSSP